MLEEEIRREAKAGGTESEYEQGTIHVYKNVILKHILDANF